VDYHLAASSGQEASAAYERALALATNPKERAFLERRLRKVTGP